MTVELTYVGPDEEYNGSDEGVDLRLVKDGPPVEVSDETAERMLSDFPDWFKKKGAGAKSSGSKSAKS